MLINSHTVPRIFQFLSVSCHENLYYLAHGNEALNNIFNKLEIRLTI